MPARSLKDGATWNQGVQAQVTASSSPDAERQGDQMSGMSTHRGHCKLLRFSLTPKGRGSRIQTDPFRCEAASASPFAPGKGSRPLGASASSSGRSRGLGGACSPGPHGTSEASRGGDHVAAPMRFQFYVTHFLRGAFKSFFPLPFALLKK